MVEDPTPLAQRLVLPRTWRALVAAAVGTDIDHQTMHSRRVCALIESWILAEPIPMSEVEGPRLAPRFDTDRFLAGLADKFDQVIGWAKSGKTTSAYIMDREAVDRMRDDLLIVVRSELGGDGGSE